MATQLNELEDAVRWYVEHVNACEGIDYLDPGHPSFINNELGQKHANLLRRYRKDYDGSRDDN